HHPLDQEDRNAAHDERYRDNLRVPEERLDMLDEDEAQNRRRQKGDEDVANKAPGQRITADQAFEHRPEGSPVEDDDCEDGAELDDDVERRPFLRVKAEQLSRQD